MKSTLSKKGQNKHTSPLTDVTNIVRKSPMKVALKVTQPETEWSMLDETIRKNENQLNARQNEIDRLNDIIFEKELVECEKDHKIATLEQMISKIKEDCMNQIDASEQELGVLKMHLGKELRQKKIKRVSCKIELGEKKYVPTLMSHEPAVIVHQAASIHELIDFEEDKKILLAQLEKNKLQVDLLQIEDTNRESETTSCSESEKQKLQKDVLALQRGMQEMLLSHAAEKISFKRIIEDLKSQLGLSMDEIRRLQTELVSNREPYQEDISSILKQMHDMECSLRNENHILKEYYSFLNENKKMQRTFLLKGKKVDIMKRTLSKQGQHNLTSVVLKNIPRKSSIRMKVAKVDHAAFKVTEQAETEWVCRKLNARQNEIDRLNDIIFEKELVECDKDHKIATLEQMISKIKEDYMNQIDASEQELGVLKMHLGKELRQKKIKRVSCKIELGEKKYVPTLMSHEPAVIVHQAASIHELIGFEEDKKILLAQQQKQQQQQQQQQQDEDEEIRLRELIRSRSLQQLGDNLGKLEGKKENLQVDSNRESETTSCSESEKQKLQKDVLRLQRGMQEMLLSHAAEKISFKRIIEDLKSQLGSSMDEIRRLQIELVSNRESYQEDISSILKQMHDMECSLRNENHILKEDTQIIQFAIQALTDAHINREGDILRENENLMHTIEKLEKEMIEARSRESELLLAKEAFENNIHDLKQLVWL